MWVLLMVVFGVVSLFLSCCLLVRVVWCCSVGVDVLRLWLLFVCVDVVRVVCVCCIC